MADNKYDQEVTSVRQFCMADGIALLVVNGHKGTGFSCQFVDKEMVKSVPALLRRMADEIESSAPDGVPVGDFDEKGDLQ
jgi:hypothetical protein